MIGFIFGWSFVLYIVLMHHVNSLLITLSSLLLLSFDRRYAEPDRVPPLPEGSGLPGGGAQRVLRRLPGHHRRATTSTRYNQVHPEVRLREWRFGSTTALQFANASVYSRVDNIRLMGKFLCRTLSLVLKRAKVAFCKKHRVLLLNSLEITEHFKFRTLKVYLCWICTCTAQYWILFIFCWICTYNYLRRASA
jgi:hypothetical protein